MALQKATFFFKDIEWGAGWTASLYKNSSNLPDLLTSAKSLANVWKNILGDGVHINYIRVSEDGMNGDSLIDTKVYKREAKEIGDDIENLHDDADCPWTSILLRCEANAQYRKNLFLRGVPDRIMGREMGSVTRGEVDPDFQKAFQKWKAKVTGDGWGFKHYKRPPDQATVAVQNVIGGTPIRVVSAGHGLVVGDRFLLTGAKYLPQSHGGKAGPSGEYTVSAVNGNELELRNTSWQDFTYDRGGLLLKRVAQVSPITNIIIIRETTRHVGRFFGQRTGRRKSAKK